MEVVELKELKLRMARLLESAAPCNIICANLSVFSPANWDAAITHILLLCDV